MEELVSHDILSFYENKKVFVTGHTGFKGAWLSAWLNMAGAEVKGYALEPDDPNSLFEVLQSLETGASVIADIRDKEKLKKEILHFQPDLIFHLAAQPLVRRSYEIPAETFDVNVTGTANLLEAACSLKKKCTIVVVTTDKVYQNLEQNVMYNESHNLGGYDPYSASKACTELVVSSFRNSFFNHSNHNHHQKAIATARAGNVIGGGDWSKDRIIPDIIRSLQNSQEIIVRNPHAIRPWQHVLEPLSGYLLLGVLLDRDFFSYSTAYNFGPHPADHLSVKNLVEKAIDAWGTGAWKDASDKNQVHEAGILQLDISKASKELKWNPKLKADTAIDWTINWYKQPAENQAAFSLEQIKAFQDL
ncbi:MAG: CDP-glucose 4,6-dehydratase [Flavisolibacter sp.]|jgi:CDP-glucose 4,6-dehydratase|nr:CDP-glucose 4,6-dehydratase [Flavisolibacter sp.]